MAPLTLSTDDPTWDVLYDGLMPHVWPLLGDLDKVHNEVEGAAAIRIVMHEEFGIKLEPTDEAIWGTVTFESAEHLTFLLLKYT